MAIQFLERADQLAESKGCVAFLSIPALGSLKPTAMVMATTAGAAVDDETITVDSATTKKLYSGTYLWWMNALDDYSLVIVTTDVEIGETVIPVLPLQKAIAALATTSTYGGIELAAAEAIPFNITQQLNEVVLLQSGGSTQKSPQSDSWNSQATYYRPTDKDRAESYRMVLDAVKNKKFLYLELMNPDGNVKSGNVTFSAWGETAQGAGYIQVSTTFEGNGSYETLYYDIT